MKVPVTMPLLLLLEMSLMANSLRAVQAGHESKTTKRELKVFPEKIHLSSARDYQSITAMVIGSDGSTTDVTSEIKLGFDSNEIVRYENETLVPLSNGSTLGEIRYQDFSVTLSIHVENAEEFPKLGFRQDILPVLTKVGCNTGKCHGSASGKDGFRLSLFGYDPVGDQYRLTREINGRRVNLADPENSLLVHKAIGSVPHTGGARIEEDDLGYRLLLEWLRQGALPDPIEAARPTSISVYPQEAVFAKPGEMQKLLVIANYSDGTDRDVTNQTVFLSNNEAAASVTEEGMVHAGEHGSAFVLARFDQFTEGASLIVRPGTSFTFPDIPSNNYIDRLVYDRLQNLNVIPSKTIEDEQFLRRAYIDLTGQLPSPSERKQFLKQSNENKRELLIASLTERAEFRDLWIMHWAELLQIRSNNGLSPKALSLYDRWSRDSVHEGKTIDEIVRSLLPASGGTFDNPAANYFQTETSPQLIAESVAQVFLGTRIQCAQCHNHPFDRWTMDDYYGFASFFSQVGYKQSVDPRELTVYNMAEGDIKHPVAGRKVLPKFLGGPQPSIPAGEDYREQLANWVTSPDNRSFAKNIVNIVWAHFLGTGIIDPIDDFRVSNPPSNPALLEALADHLVEYRFDVKRLAKDICSSRTYQLSVATNESNALDHRNFSHGMVRRMRAEVLLDCIGQVTQSPDKLPGLGENGKAVQIADGPTPNYFLTTFGRSTRQSPCSCEVKTNPTLSQAMHLLNGETTNGKIKQGQVVSKPLQGKEEPSKIVVELFQRCFSREPSNKELQEVLGRLGSYQDKGEGLEDFFWALLNSNEFIFNH